MTRRALPPGQRQGRFPMTLQYRIRSKYEDELWRQRVYLCEKLLEEAYDKWCRSDDPFPTTSFVAGVLYLFSPRCDPYRISPHRVNRQVAEVVDAPEVEYHLTWPKREPEQAAALVAALTGIMNEAIQSWEQPDSEVAAGGSVSKRLVEEIVTQQYVIFHHKETTRRDLNHWGI